MTTETIEYLAYLIKEAKNNDSPKPIVFLGAGASVSGGIPLAKEIASKILTDFANNPKIKTLKEEDKENYALLMSLLTPEQRNSFLRDLVDNAKVNVTHIYLAQMMLNGFIDYFLTVNFDNLMLRALALFNNFPPTYDISILKDITTTPFHPQSITYLHGQHNGQWLLNTHDEMDKPKEVIPAILNQLKNNRTWIILGYSGNDPIIEHLAKLGRYNSGLYWIGYEEQQPLKQVKDLLLDNPNLNTYLISGYDSDSFCLKLNNELNLNEPQIFNTPFSFLKDIQNNIVDIDGAEIYKDVKRRLDISKKLVDDAIKKYEIQESTKMSDYDIAVSNLKKEIISAIVKESYENANELLSRSLHVEDPEIKEFLSSLYNNWGIYLSELKQGMSIDDNKNNLMLSFQKFDQAISINPKNYHAYNNWGNSLSRLAKLTDGKSVKETYILAFKKYEQALTISPDNDEIYNNWGYELSAMAENLPFEEKMKYFDFAFKKYEQAIKINPENQSVYINWAESLVERAEDLPPKEQKECYTSSFEKYRQAASFDKQNDKIYNSWGTSLCQLAEKLSLKEQIIYFNLGFEKFEQAAILNPKSFKLFNNWGINLCKLAKKVSKNKQSEYLAIGMEKLKKAISISPEDSIANTNFNMAQIDYAKLQTDSVKNELLNKCLENLKKFSEINGDYYNLSCCYALLHQKEFALNNLEKSLKNAEIDKDHILNDADWKEYSNDINFISLINKY